jgi:hypothetical protein
MFVLKNKKFILAWLQKLDRSPEKLAEESPGGSL